MQMRNITAVFFKLGTRNFTSQKKQNGTYYVERLKMIKLLWIQQYGISTEKGNVGEMYCRGKKTLEVCLMDFIWRG